MSALNTVFETGKAPVKEEHSFLNALLSCSLIRGTYPKEKPEIDFEFVGSNIEKRRLIALVNNIAKNSPTGRKILEDAAKGGYSLGFESQRGSYGFCSAEKKVIRLSPGSSDKTLTSVLVHEARHAQQHLSGIPTRFCSQDIATEIKLRRSTEADAQAAAAQASLEIGTKTKDTGVWMKFKQNNPEIAYRIDVRPSIDTMGDVLALKNETMQKAFIGWFDQTQMLDSYESGYLLSHMQSIEMAPDPVVMANIFADKPFSGHMTSEQIVNKVCVSDNGKSYFADNPNILDNEKMCGITRETREAADYFFHERKLLTGQEADNSYKALPDRGSMFNRMMNSLSALRNLKCEKSTAPKTVNPIVAARLAAQKQR